MRRTHIPSSFRWPVAIALAAGLLASGIPAAAATGQGRSPVTQGRTSTQGEASTQGGACGCPPGPAITPGSASR